MQPSSEQTGASAPPVLTAITMAGEWVLDPQASSIRIKTRSMWGLVPVSGVFHELSGKGTVQPDGKVTGTIVVAAASIDTKNRRRDKHLRSTDFLDCDHTPHIIFTADGVQASGRRLTVAGALTVRSHTRPMSIDALAEVRSGDMAWLDTEVGIDRAEFGLAWNLIGMASMNNTLNIHAVFRRQ